ncbi:MAG: radical SAM protein [Actinomycetaceae bacterium]|nr:radical SAM protein [Actinomycetaceae bacterium]MDY6082287.1 radical SAM protein [Actinomycetaceae bacterium]
MQYHGTVYRPPIEASTFLIPVTEGCTYNKCNYCSMYKGVPFRMVPMDAIEEFLANAAYQSPLESMYLDRVYLVGGDPFALSARRLDNLLDLIYKYFPNVTTVSMYAATPNIASKTDEQLVHLHERGIDDLYIGVETGLDSALTYLNKESSAEETTAQLLRLNEAGIHHRCLFMLGAAGKGKGVENAIASAQMMNVVQPEMVAFTTMAAYPGTQLLDDVKEGRFQMAPEYEILEEEKTFLEHIDVPDAYFLAGHALDSVPLRGKLGSDKTRMIELLDQALSRVGSRENARVFG